jgi:hypothetical protein
MTKTQTSPTCLTSVVSRDPYLPDGKRLDGFGTDDIEVTVDGGPLDLHTVLVKVCAINRKVEIRIITAELWAQNLADRELATHEELPE